MAVKGEGAFGLVYRWTHPLPTTLREASPRPSAPAVLTQSASALRPQSPRLPLRTQSPPLDRHSPRPSQSPRLDRMSPRPSAPLLRNRTTPSLPVCQSSVPAPPSELDASRLTIALDLSCLDVSKAPECPPPSQLKRLQLLLAQRHDLKVQVTKIFKQLSPNAQQIDYDAVKDFLPKLSQALQIDELTIDDLDAECERFDFDGSGYLHYAETYQLVKHRLLAQLKTLGGLSEVEVPTKSVADAGYCLAEELGRGNQGVARRAVDKEGREFCIKINAKEHGAKSKISEMTDLSKEFETMRKLTCPRIAVAFELFQDSTSFFMVNDILKGGDLTKLRKHMRQQGVTSTEAYWQGVWRQCFEALHFLHQHALMHCDVKETNIMLRSADVKKPDVVFIDFGLTRAMTADEPGLVTGTPGYIPPETWQTGKWYPNGDIFSMGVTIVQVMTLRSDTQNWIFGAAPQRTYKEIQAATTHSVPPFHQMPREMPGLGVLAQKLLFKDRKYRYRAPTSLNDRWLWEECSQLQWSNVGWVKRLWRRPPKIPIVQPDDLLGTFISPEFFNAVSPPGASKNTIISWPERTGELGGA